MKTIIVATALVLLAGCAVDARYSAASGASTRNEGDLYRNPACDETSLCRFL